MPTFTLFAALDAYLVYVGVWVYVQAYQRLCAAVKRAQRYPALGCNCRTCNSLVEVRAAEAEATQTLKSQIGCACVCAGWGVVGECAL